MRRASRHLVPAVIPLLIGWMLTAAAGDSDTDQTIQDLKTRIDRLEATVHRLETAGTAPESESVPESRRAHLAVSATGVIQGSTGVEKELSNEKDTTDAVMAFELEADLRITSSDILYAHVIAGDGGGLDAHLPSLSIFNGDAYDEGHLLVSEFWYEKSLSFMASVFEIGKIGLSGPGDFGPENAILFDGNEYANNERSQFLAGCFINNLTLEFPDENGLAALWRVTPVECVDILFGAGEADGDWYDLFDDLFAIGEIDWRTALGSRSGTWRFYGWYNGKEHEDFTDPADTNRVNYGAGLSIDQELTDRLGGFARYGWQSPEVSQIESSWSIGLQLAAPLPGRNDDRVGIAYGKACLSDDWKDAHRETGLRFADEHHAEIYYALACTDWATLTPDLQWIKHPNGERDRDDIWIIGIRARVAF